MSPHATPYAGHGKNWRAGKRTPGSRQTRIEIWLQDHPGLWRASDIADALHEDGHSIAMACYQLHLTGRALREEIPPDRRAELPTRPGARWTGYRVPSK